MPLPAAKSALALLGILVNKFARRAGMRILDGSDQNDCGETKDFKNLRMRFSCSLRLTSCICCCAGFAGFVLASQIARGAEPQADLVVLNGKIVTLDAQSSIVQAAAIRGGRFVAVT